MDELPLVVDLDDQLLVFIQRLWFIRIYTRVGRRIAATTLTDLIEVVAIYVVNLIAITLSLRQRIQLHIPCLQDIVCCVDQLQLECVVLCANALVVSERNNKLTSENRTIGDSNVGRVGSIQSIVPSFYIT